mmetsp:Transcript_5444/g.18092  ORF Transcript_5444/g.18092 Transcript_5444/m.18092 type:complete len:268 (-) Transcript_5444:1300-2103(-)
MPPPPPRVSIFGFAAMELHFGMCRSAACWLKRRPQWGQVVRSSCSCELGSAGGSGKPAACAACTCRPALSAAWKAAWSRFHFGILLAGIELSPPPPAEPQRAGGALPPPPPPPYPPPAASLSLARAAAAEPIRVAAAPFLTPARGKEDLRLGPRVGTGEPPNSPAVPPCSRCRDESHTWRDCELTATFWQMAKWICRRSEAKLRPQQGHGTMLDGSRFGSSSNGSSPALARATAADSGESGRPSLPIGTWRGSVAGGCGPPGRKGGA